MRAGLMLSLTWVLACGTPEQVASEPKAAKAPHIDFSMEVIADSVVRSGNRVWSDGRVEVFDGTRWTTDRTLDASQLERFTTALEAPTVDDMPDVLEPRTPPSPDQPRPTVRWTLDRKGTTRTVTFPNYDGLRPPSIEAITRTLVPPRSVDGLNVTITTSRQAPGGAHRTRLACAPKTIAPLRPLLGPLSTRDASVIDTADLDGLTPLVSIVWNSGGETWSKALYTGGRVLRDAGQSRLDAFRLDAEQATELNTILETMDWASLPDMCTRRPGELTPAPTEE